MAQWFYLHFWYLFREERLTPLRRRRFACQCGVGDRVAAVAATLSPTPHHVRRAAAPGPN